MSIIKTSNGWAFRTDLGKDPATGKRKQLYKSGFRTKKEAQLAEAEFKLKIKNEGFFSTKNEQMNTFLSKWLHTVYKHEVQSTTFQRAKQVIKNHIIPELGNKEVREIKTYDVQQFLSTKLESGLSPATVKIIRNVLSKAFQTAVIWELIQMNPIERVKGPTVESKKIETWSADEAKKFIDACDDLRWKVGFSLALHTGMRRGEILGLKWKNVDFESRIIKVRETLAYTEEQGLFFKTPKTKNSIREILVSPNLLELLDKLWRQQQRMKERMGPCYHSNDLVICTEDGKPIFPRNFVRTFKRIIKKAGVKEISIHSLRHTNATLLMKQNINPKIVSERLGHANVGITLDIYSHTDLEMQKETVSHIEKIFS